MNCHSATKEVLTQFPLRSYRCETSQKFKPCMRARVVPMADELAPHSGYAFGRRCCRNSPTKSIMYPKNRQAILQSTPNRYSLPENLTTALTAVVINPISEDFELEEVMNTPSLREEMISNPLTRARLIGASGSRQSRPSKRISSHIFGSVSLLDSLDITPNTPSCNNTPINTFTPLQRIPPPMRLSQAFVDDCTPLYLDCVLTVQSFIRMSLVILRMKNEVTNAQKEKQILKTQALNDAQNEIKRILNNKEEYEEMTNKFWIDIEETVKELNDCKEDNYSKCFYTIKRLYNLLTTNQNYSMSYNEFIENIFEVFHVYLSKKEYSELKKSIDPSNSNVVDFEQFIYWYRQFKPKMSCKVPTCIKFRKIFNESEKRIIERRMVQQTITLKHIEQMLNICNNKFQMVFICPVCHSFEDYRYKILCKHIVKCRKYKENQNRKISSGSAESYFEFNRRNRRSTSSRISYRSNNNNNNNGNSQNLI